MDDFHKANMKHVDGMDYNANRYVRRRKKDGQMLRQLARTRLKQKLSKEKKGEF